MEIVRWMMADRNSEMEDGGWKIKMEYGGWK